MRSNAAQSLAVAARDLAAIADEADGAYSQRLLRGTQALLDDGATNVDLVNIEWGPISILGATATATTVETWRTTYAAGPTEFARDRNVYSLALDEEGAWRIVSNSHPDGRPQFSSSPPADTDPQPDIDEEVEIPTGQATSRNWSGYAARGEEFTSVSGTWVVPEVGLETPFGADAAWVGIGGYRSRDLIQAGTQSISSGNGRVAYQAWYEKLPDYAHPVPLTILPGHTVNVSIDQQAPDTWLITLTNVTTGDVHRRTEEYQSSRTSAEWIQEAPFARRRVLPLSHFGNITFTVRLGHQRRSGTDHRRPRRACHLAGRQPRSSAGRPLAPGPRRLELQRRSLAIRLGLSARTIPRAHRADTRPPARAPRAPLPAPAPPPLGRLLARRRRPTRTPR